MHLSGPRAPSAAPGGGGLPRERLLRRLDPGLTRVTLVLAPPGSGKTTLLQQWAAATRLPVAWWRPGAADDTLAHTVAAALPGAADGRAGVLARLARHPTPVTLLVDGDLTRAEAAELERFLLIAPEQLRLVLAARARPALDVTRSELAARVVGAGELAFRPGETEALFRDHYRMPLSPGDAEALTRSTGGWAAALCLFEAAVAEVPAGERGAAIARQLRRPGYARHHLDQLLATLPSEQATFLRETAGLEVLTSAACDALLGVTGSGGVLRRLAHDFPFLISHDAGASFTLHRLVRSHLLAERAERLDARAVADWLRTAAALQQDRPAAAARAYVAGADWPTLAQHAGRAWEALSHDDLGWTEDVPDAELARHPRLMLLHARHALRDGRLTDAAAEADRAAHLLAEAEDGWARARAAAIAQAAYAWLGHALGEADTAESWPLSLRGALGGRAPSPARGASLEDRLPAIVARLVTGDLVTARQQLASLEPLAATDPATQLLVGTLRLLAGAVALTAELADELAGLARAAPVPWLNRLAGAIERAPDHLDATPEDDPLARQTVQADRLGDPWGAAVTTALRAVLLLRRGEPDIADLEALVERLRRLRAPALEAWARSALALATAAGQLPEAGLDAESAAAFATACQVPGARATAYAALAMSEPARQAELMATVRSEATVAGFDATPWSWLRRPARRLGPIQEQQPPVMVRCFGSFVLEIDGRQPATGLVRPRARQLLRMLAAHAGGSVHRDTLLDALWPDLDPEAATHNLHVAVSSLRTMLEPGVPRGASRLLIRQDERYQLALPPGSRSDVRDFDGALEGAAAARLAGDLGRVRELLDDAVRLYRGDVLPEDGPAEWVLPIRDRYRLRASESAALLAELHLQAGDPGLAAEVAHRAVEIDAWRDASWRILLMAHAAAGDHAALQRTRAAYAVMLADLGVRPDVHR